MRLCGAGLGVVFVVLAVVVPAQKFEVVEVGGSVVGWRPVFDVVGFTALRWLVAAGVLAVLIAHDERFPLRGGDGAGRRR